MTIRSRNLIAAVLALVVAAAVQTAPGATAATLTPRAALLQRINQVRAAHGLRAVYPSSSLQGAARRHSHDMISRDYFAHTSPTGSTVATRIANTGFVSGYAWTGGETLAWGVGSLDTPTAIVSAWMHSPEHRAILMSSQYRWVGINRACGSFLGHSGACVWTADWVKRW
jgi:uncharacterized protein YkwD